MIPLLHRLCYNYYFVALAVKKCSKASQPPTKKVKTGKGSDEEDIMVSNELTDIDMYAFFSSCLHAANNRTIAEYVGEFFTAWYCPVQ